MGMLVEFTRDRPPIIWTTGFEFLSWKQKRAVARMLGLHAVLTKPVDSTHLLEEVSKALRAA
jgi:hypothetical protein